jgi:hypothetical protein
VLTDEQRRELQTRDWTRLESIVLGADIDAIADRMWAFFAKRGIDRQDRRTWPVGFTGKTQGLRQSGVFNVFATPTTAGLVDQLLGAGQWGEAEAWGPALVTFPQPGPWELSHKNWHFDLPARGDPQRPAAARLFGFVSHVAPQGGGTLVVQGSHELVCRIVSRSPDHDAGQSADVRHQLAAMHPWFAALGRAGKGRLQQFMLDGDEIDGVRVQVAELTGRPGDVVAMMPWTLHNMSMNCATVPRFMVTHTILRHDQTFYPGAPASSKRGPAPAYKS